MTYLGVLEAPPEGFRRITSLLTGPGEVWARGSMFSPDFAWCHVRKEEWANERCHAAEHES